MQTIKQSIITIIVCIAVVAGVSMVYSATWVGPTQAPPGGNVSTPINVGSASQYKSGALSIGGLLQAPQIQLTTGAATGKVLTSDASGLASWQTGGGASGVSQIIAGTNITISPAGGTGAVTINSTGGGGTSYWALSGANIYNTNTGNVGIGTASPSQKLEVSGNMKVNGLYLGLNSAAPSGVPGFVYSGITTGVRTDNFNVINTSGSGYTNVWANDYYIGATGKWASTLGGGGAYLPLSGGTMNSGATIDNAGRMHIASQENIFLLARGGNTYVSSAWGGAGNLNIDGQICLKGNCISSWPRCNFEGTWAYNDEGGGNDFAITCRNGKITGWCGSPCVSRGFHAGVYCCE